jgi:hypothetical protein
MKCIPFASAALVAALLIPLPAFAGGDGGSTMTPAMMAPERAAFIGNEPFKPRFSDRNLTPAVTRADSNTFTYPDGSSVRRRTGKDGRQYLVFRYSNGSSAAGYGKYVGTNAGGGDTWELTSSSGKVFRFSSIGPHTGGSVSTPKAK